MSGFRKGKLDRISRRYEYFYNQLNGSTTFEFGVAINCSSDEDSDVEILNDTISTMNTDTMTGNIPNDDIFDEIMQWTLNPLKSQLKT